MLKKTVFIAGLILLLAAMHAPHAEAGVGFTLRPVKVSHTMQPGEIVSGSFTLINESDEDINVVFAVEDFVPTAGTTNISFVGRAEGNTTVRDWITFDAPNELVFKKGGSIEVPYTIVAPPNAEPGSHFGVIFFTGSRIDDTGQLKVGTRMGMLIYVTIPGNQLQKGKLLAFTGPGFIERGPVEFGITFENTGTVHYEPKGSIVIKNIFGRTVDEVSVEGQAVLPSGVREWKVGWGGDRMLLGWYSAAIAIRDGEGNELTADSVSFVVLPIWYAIGILAAILTIFLLLKFLRGRVHISISMGKPANGGAPAVSAASRSTTKSVQKARSRRSAAKPRGAGGGSKSAGSPKRNKT